MRLIDKDEAIRRIHVVDDTGISLETVTKITNLCEDVLEAMPTIDAEPVIRCKDCRHAKVSKDNFDLDGITPLCDCHYMNQPQRWNEFCSWAEPKMNGKEN